MGNSIKKSKITLEKLARMTANEFKIIHKKLENTATKDDLKYFATKEDLKDFKEEVLEEVRNENRKVLLSNDTLVTKLDILLKDSAAHTALHKRTDDTLADHEKRIKKVEAELIK